MPSPEETCCVKEEIMEKEEFQFMEVKPKSAGHYLVTVYCKHPAQYIKDTLKYDGDSWVYNTYDE